MADKELPDHLKKVVEDVKEKIRKALDGDDSGKKKDDK